MIASERLLNDEHVTLPRGTQGINEAAVSGRQTIHDFCSEGVKWLVDYFSDRSSPFFMVKILLLNMQKITFIKLHSNNS